LRFEFKMNKERYILTYLPYHYWFAPTVHIFYSIIPEDDWRLKIQTDIDWLAYLYACSERKWYHLALRALIKVCMGN